MKEVISMSTKETERISVMEDLLAKRIKQKHVAQKLGISARQVRRILKRYKQEKSKGLVHKSRGRVGNRAIPQEEQERIVTLIRKRYTDFGPTFALEKLREYHGINRSDETIRKIMIAADIWKPKQRKDMDIHPYRERKSCVGEMVQLDGSPHDWFEGRRPPCTLVAFIDDATSAIKDGAFVDYEGTSTLFDSTEHYLLLYGKPLALYVDKHSTFRVNRQATIEEELKDQQTRSQFGRAMDDFSVTLIFAHSPQAKGRVERLFETLQDRLIKEMRLAGISTKEEGTKFFREVYIPKHNAKFAVSAREPADMHRSLLASDDLSRIFTMQSKRKVTKDLIVQYKNTRYQLMPPTGYFYTLRGTTVVVEEDRKGNIVIRYKELIIPTTIAVQKIHKEESSQTVSSKEFKEDRVRIPGWDHPWRQARRLAIELAKQHHERENGVTVLTQNGGNDNVPIISSV